MSIDVVRATSSFQNLGSEKPFIQDLGQKEYAFILGGVAPPARPAGPPSQLTPQQVHNTQAFVIASTLGAAAGNPIGAGAIGQGAGANYVMNTLHPGLVWLNRLLNGRR